MTPRLSRIQIALEVFLIQFLFFNTLWNLYYFEKSSYAVFLSVFLTLVLVAYSVFAHWEGLSHWGLRLEGFKQGARHAWKPFLVFFLVCFSYSFLKRAFPVFPKWSKLFEFPLAGLLQHFIFQGFFYNRYQIIFRNKWISIFLAATTFALFHLPNKHLIVITFLTGLYASYLFSRFRNLFVVALLHGLISLTMTMSLEPAGLIKSYRVGPEPMGRMIQEIKQAKDSDTKIGQFVPHRGIAGNFERAFDRHVEEIKTAEALDRFLNEKKLSFVAIAREDFVSLKAELKSSVFIWNDYRVWLRKFPKRRSQTLLCVLTFNYKRLDELYREDILLISNRRQQSAAAGK